MGSKLFLASPVASAESRKSGGGLKGIFFDEERESFGALPGSSLTEISPPTVSSNSGFMIGERGLLEDFRGEIEAEFVTEF